MVLIPRGKTATITHYSTNSDGDRTAAGTVTVKGVAVWPATTEELVAGQDTVTWDVTALLPKGTDVRSTDTVTIDGTVYEVNGRPARAQSQLTGSDWGLQVQLRAQTG